MSCVILSGVGGGPMAVREILSGMVQRSSNVTRIVDKLISKGYVQRCECPTNRRKMDVSMTPQGRAILKRLDQKVHEFHRPMIQKLSVEELKRLDTLIH